MDLGLSEFDFWNMTPAEIRRYIESQSRIKKRDDQTKASFDYILADLIGRSIARVYNSANKMPTLSEAYPSLFDKAKEAERIQARKDELSVARFKQFALITNMRIKGGELKSDE